MLNNEISTICTLMLVILLGCDGSVDRDSQGLIVLKGAIDPSFYNLGGSDQVIYQLEAKYPATDVIAEITLALKKMGWEPMAEDYLNPGSPTSHVTGWGDFVDRTTTSPQQVYQWMANWKNEQEDIVLYGFKYTYPEGAEPILDKLDVVAVYIPADVLKEQQEALLPIEQALDQMEDQFGSIQVGTTQEQVLELVGDPVKKTPLPSSLHQDKGVESWEYNVSEELGPVEVYFDADGKLKRIEFHPDPTGPAFTIMTDEGL